jgi:hypothetical protein
LPVSKLPEMWSVNVENESDVKCNHEVQHSLLAENQYNVDNIH